MWRRPEMPAGLKLIETVPGPIIDIETLRAHCRIVTIDLDSDTDAATIDSHPEDALLLGYLEAAVEYAEDYTGLTIAQRTFEMAMDAFPRSVPCTYSTWQGIQIPRAPLVRVLSFTAVGGGSEGELDEGDNFIVDDFQTPPLLRPVIAWPATIPSPNNVRIRFQAGYKNGVNDDSDWVDAPALPAGIKHALLLLVGHFYENRENSVAQALENIPVGVEALLNLKRIRTGIA